MKNKAKQRYTARKMASSESRLRHQVLEKILTKVRRVKGGTALHLPAFLNLWKCKDGACKQLKNEK